VSEIQREGCENPNWWQILGFMYMGYDIYPTLHGNPPEQ